VVRRGHLVQLLGEDAGDEVGVEGREGVVDGERRERVGWRQSGHLLGRIARVRFTRGAAIPRCREGND